MRIHIVAILSAVIGLAAVAMAAPPEINIPETERTGSLSAASVDQLKTWITFYVDAIRDAKDDQQVLAAKNKLAGLDAQGHAVEDGYRKYDAVPYQFAFANVYSTVATPLFGNWPKDPYGLKACKEVNLAMAAEKMPQTSIQDLLEVMIAHPNAGVRLCAWKGYSAAAPAIVPQAAKLKIFLSSLAARSPKEQSAQVVAGMVRAMATVAPGADTANILAANWDKWCGVVMAGDADMAAAASNMVQSIEMIERAAGASDKDVHRELLQALVDVAVSAARAYDTAKGKGPAGEANKILLEYCEDALNSVSGQTKSTIRAAMRNDKSADVFADVKTAVYGWKDELKSVGVHDPEIVLPTTLPRVLDQKTSLADPLGTPTTQPATAPAQ